MKQTNKVVTQTKKQETKEFVTERDALADECATVKNLKGKEYAKARIDFLRKTKVDCPTRLAEVLANLPK